MQIEPLPKTKAYDSHVLKLWSYHCTTRPFLSVVGSGLQVPQIFCPVSGSGRFRKFHKICPKRIQPNPLILEISVRLRKRPLGELSGVLINHAPNKNVQ